MAAKQVFEGTLEELNRRKEAFSGKRLRIEVLGDLDRPIPPAEHPIGVSADARARSILDWGYGHRPRRSVPLTDEAISRDSVYSDD